jgi:hypothetical protein
MAYLLFLSVLLSVLLSANAATCSLRPLGAGHDDTNQVCFFSEAIHMLELDYASGRSRNRKMWTAWDDYV